MSKATTAAERAALILQAAGYEVSGGGTEDGSKFGRSFTMYTHGDGVAYLYENGDWEYNGCAGARKGGPEALADLGRLLMYT